MYRRILPVAAVAALLACETAVIDPAGETGVALQIVEAQGFRSSADRGRIWVEGPTTTNRFINPGQTLTIDGLQPSPSYVVAVEGLVGSEVESYGERTGINVVAGQNTPVTVNLASFVPTITGLPTSVEVGQPVTVSFSPVAHATSYVVEADDDPGFASPSRPPVSGTSATLTPTDPGTIHVRVRAVNRHSSQGQFSDPGSVDVTELVLTLSKVSGDDQVGAAGDTLPAPLVVVVEDAQGAVSGQPVSFSVTQGGGVLTGASTTTDVNGQASAFWILGPSVGVQRVLVESGGTSVEFTAAAQPAAVATIEGSVRAGGTGLANVQVALDGPQTAGAATDGNGDFAFTDLPLGTYTVTISDFGADVTFSETSQTVTLTEDGQVVRADFDGTLALQITTESLPAGEVGVPYDEPLEAVGGVEPYSWSLSGGTPPPGLTVQAAGALAGTPDSPGTFPFTVRVTDQPGDTVSKNFTVTITTSELTITSPQTLLGGCIGAQIPTQQLTAVGGAGAPYTWAVVAGTLPTNVEVLADGTLRNVPGTTLQPPATTYNITLEVKDQAGGTATKNHQIGVQDCS